MDGDFINNIVQIILDHLDDNKFGADKLASEIGLSNSQILKKVKAQTGKSVTQLITETRLKEAAKLILDTDNTASEIAYKVGYSSPSYFNKCFNKFFGVTPGEYKEKGKNIFNTEIPKEPVKKQKSNSRLIFSGTILAALLISAIISITSKNEIPKSTAIENSIAVLYFDDMSSDSNNQWFCDGITDEISSNLSKIKGLRVISSTSSKKYKNSDKTIPEIAKELGVNFIVEGSVKKYMDTVRIKVKLIGANDEKIWFHDYDEKLDNILKIQSDVAKQVAQKLKITMNPQEEKALNSFPTENMEAYQQFLKGRSIFEKVSQNKKESLNIRNTSIGYFKKAVELDSNFSEAYAEMALVYFIMYLFDGRDQLNLYYAEENIDLALNLDSDKARSNSIKGMIHYFGKGEKETGKELLEKAIALDPHEILSHIAIAVYYSGYNEKPKDLKKALNYINIADQLDPYNPFVFDYRIPILIKNEKFDEAEEYLNKCKPFIDSPLFESNYNFFVRKKVEYICKQKEDWTEAIKLYHQEIEKDPENSYFLRHLGYAYNGILNDDKAYLKYMKEAYKSDSTTTVNAHAYHLALLENKKFEESKDLLNDESFRTLLDEGEFEEHNLLYYYFLGDMEKAHKIIKDYDIPDSSPSKLYTLAQLGKIKQVNRLLKEQQFNISNKAYVFAILREKDSMYYYLNKDDIESKVINCRFEFDPYRKEEKYKEFLRRNFLPITNYNETNSQFLD